MRLRALDLKMRLKNKRAKYLNACGREQHLKVSAALARTKLSRRCPHSIFRLCELWFIKSCSSGEGGSLWTCGLLANRIEAKPALLC